jgi:Complex 1 protein (LYR family)
MYMYREIPRVLTIYDITNMGAMDMRRKVRSLFYRNAKIKDERVIDALIEIGYNDLEYTLLQYKQKTHLMLLLEGHIGTDYNEKRLGPDASEEEQFNRWL